MKALANARIAAVYLKNRVNRGWATGEDTPLQIPIPAEEKGPFRERLLPILASSSSPVRAQLVPILQKILQSDFPADWPDFMATTLRLLSTQDSSSVYTGLQCMLAICRTYRFKAGDGREEFGSIIQVSFDHLLNIGNRLVEERSIEAGEMLRMVMKSFKHAIYVCWLDSKRDRVGIRSSWPGKAIDLQGGPPTPPRSTKDHLLQATISDTYSKCKKVSS